MAQRVLAPAAGAHAAAGLGSPVGGAATRPGGRLTVRGGGDAGSAGSTMPVRRRVVRPLWALWTALGGLLLAVACSLVADGRVPSWEREVFQAVNGLPDWLYRPMWLVQILGVLGVPVIVAVVALVWRKWRLALALLLLVPLKLIVELRVLKALVERGRPGQTEPGAVLRHVPPAGLSFPSGHAIVVFAIAVLLLPYLRGWWRVVPFALALLACISRVYLGAHNPLDVAAGAGAGLLLGGLLTLLVGVPTDRPTRRERGSPAPAVDAGTAEG